MYATFTEARRVIRALAPASIPSLRTTPAFSKNAVPSRTRDCTIAFATRARYAATFHVSARASSPRAPSSTDSARCGPRSGLKPPCRSGRTCSSVVVGVSKLVETFA